MPSLFLLHRGPWRAGLCPWAGLGLALGGSVGPQAVAEEPLGGHLLLQAAKCGCPPALLLGLHPQLLPHHPYPAPLRPVVLWWTEAETEEVPYNYV